MGKRIHPDGVISLADFKYFFDYEYGCGIKNIHALKNYYFWINIIYWIHKLKDGALGLYDHEIGVFENDTCFKIMLLRGIKGSRYLKYFINMPKENGKDYLDIHNADYGVDGIYYVKWIHLLECLEWEIGDV